MTKLTKEPIVVSIIMLFLGVLPFPEGYYTLLRIIVFLTFCYLTFFAFQKQERKWGWVFCFLLTLFNPFIPVHFIKGTWVCIDIIAAFLLIFFINPKNKILKVVVCFIVGVCILGVVVALVVEHDKESRPRHLRLLE